MCFVVHDREFILYCCLASTQKPNTVRKKYQCSNLKSSNEVIPQYRTIQVLNNAYILLQV